VPISNYEGLYSISDEGKVRSDRTGKLRALVPLPNGYITVQLWKNGEKRAHYVHHLVARAFVGPAPSPVHEVNHKDLDKSNCRASNLEWLSKPEHTDHNLEHGATARGVRNAASKLTDDDVRDIRRRKANGETYDALSERFQVGWTTIQSIVLEKTWRHVK
jgi:hypothetical protein